MEIQNKTLSNLRVIFSEFITVQFPGPDALLDAVVVGVHGYASGSSFCFLGMSRAGLTFRWFAISTTVSSLGLLPFFHSVALLLLMPIARHTAEGDVFFFWQISFSVS